MLAYVFWHTRGDHANGEAYEQALREFQGALVDEPPPGFLGCAAHRLDGCTWQAEPAYADWYLVDDWHSLGVLNGAAVDARRRSAHDQAAGRAAAGAGGIYLLREGSHCVDVGGAELWLDKLPGKRRDELRAELASTAGDGAAVWERQMVLGPAPEFCAVSTLGAAPAAATVVNRNVVFAAV